MKKTRLRFKTVFISDIHLGTRDAKVKEVTRFIRHIDCERLVLNGDIIDGWYLKRKNSAWTSEHTRFVRHLLKMAEKQDTEVIYLRGNHDEMLDGFLPLAFGSFQLDKEYIHKTPQGDYLVVHGDGFDHVTTNHKWVAGLGSLCYEALLNFNRLYNAFRAWRGKEYFSVSKLIKAKVKGAVSFVGRYEEQLEKLARARGCVGIICGHIHTAENKRMGSVHYLNSGDWVESLTAIVETEPGEFSLIDYANFDTMLKVEKSRQAGSGGIHLQVVSEAI